MVLIGIAQEKTPVWRSWKAKGQEHLPHPHMEWGRQMAVVQPLLLLPAGPGVGRRVLEDLRVRALADLDLPGTFRTKVITKGVDPQVNCYYKASRIKQYFKEHRACALRR